MFKPGTNIAMKIPPAQFQRTVAFYRDLLGFEELPRTAGESGQNSESVALAFGDKTLWLDCVPQVSQAEIWLEVLTDDAEEAARVLALGDCQRCDEIEALPPGFEGFWVSNPANIIHLVTAGG